MNIFFYPFGKYTEYRDGSVVVGVTNVTSLRSSENFGTFIFMRNVFVEKAKLNIIVIIGYNRSTS